MPHSLAVFDLSLASITDLVEFLLLFPMPIIIIIIIAMSQLFVVRMV